MVLPLLALVVTIAVIATGARRLSRARQRRALGELPGGSPERPIAIRSFAEMDGEIARRRCPCGARFGLAGEGSREIGDQRFRVAQLRCVACEEEIFLFFETTGLLQ